MGTISIEESEHTRLTEAAGRVAALEERATTAERDRDEARADSANLRRSHRAGEIIGARAQEAKVTFTPREVKGFLADLPLTEAGDLDEAAFTTTVDEEAKAKAPGTTEGIVTGMGGQLPELTEGDQVNLATVTNLIGEAFGHSSAGNQVKEA